MEKANGEVQRRGGARLRRRGQVGGRRAEYTLIKTIVTLDYGKENIMKVCILVKRET